ncbi:hypothetical protein BJ875DRAFT_498308 [Amylocarpus encephaloides]|uniref:F-box domain-containing protein n=1 Tax=Amylocarpus encephaloides TaxID=45428 RepID=A0A9P7YD22_9HELO|nr:hypothetical protein BJ875DRAFT_498308 [Amylocarpus encephaloides]
MANLFSPEDGMGPRDCYGRRHAALPCLSIDRVMENRLFVSTAPLLKIPRELLLEIVQAIDSKSLSALALVNSDCRQFARLRQFAHVTFNHYPSSKALIQSLDGERKRREIDPLNPVAQGRAQGTIGPCIQSITVHMFDNWIDCSVEDQLIINCDSFFEYTSIIEKIVNDGTTLPHLDLVVWRDVFSPRKYCYLSKSPIRYLHLIDPIIEDFDISPWNNPCDWKLQALTVIQPVVPYTWRNDISLFGRRILWDCAPTLQHLTWVGGRSFKLANELGEPPCFKMLRYLQVLSLDLPTTRCWNILLTAPLVGLCLRYSEGSILHQALEECGYIRTLETFVWNGSLHSPCHLSFLSVNNHILRFALDHPSSADILENRLLPMFGTHFKNLRSLSLIWPQDLKVLSESALSMISQIRSLEQLHLTVGNVEGWRYSRNWRVDHNAIRHHLKPLSHLQKIAFSGDEYPRMRGELEHEPNADYWSTADALSGEEIIGADDEQMLSFWEEIHKCTCLREAGVYAEVFPKMTWIFLGQLPMRVVSGGGRKTVIPLTENRDNCATLLKRMFGWVGRWPVGRDLIPE